jgi:hypothetical protein
MHLFCQPTVGDAFVFHPLVGDAFVLHPAVGDAFFFHPSVGGAFDLQPTVGEKTCGCLQSGTRQNVSTFTAPVGGLTK